MRIRGKLAVRKSVPLYIEGFRTMCGVVRSIFKRVIRVGVRCFQFKFLSYPAGACRAELDDEVPELMLKLKLRLELELVLENLILEGIIEVELDELDELLSSEKPTCLTTSTGRKLLILST